MTFKVEMTMEKKRISCRKMEKFAIFVVWLISLIQMLLALVISLSCLYHIAQVQK